METGEAPLAVATVTSTVPVPAGLVATICVPVSLTIEATAAPNFTVAVPAVPRFMPVIVTWVPPLKGPEAGLTPVTAGSPGVFVNVNWSAAEMAEVPAELVTVTSTVPVPRG